MVVEIAGGPGVGKTSAAIGLAMDARRAAEARKINGEEEGKRGGDVLIVGELGRPLTSAIVEGLFRTLLTDVYCAHRSH